MNEEIRGHMVHSFFEKDGQDLFWLIFGKYHRESTYLIQRVHRG
ncbi:hypothetical protein [Leptospira noguchii]|nr:hypothetical protein [Leptospira noguchii]EMI61990.1 hypothetical protein LEP1GSC072_1406 [Leptospira noguchii str. Bonito]